MKQIGVDVGGTFTDILLFDDVARRVRVKKHLSTPQDPSIAFLEGVDALAEDGVPTAELDRVVHATTVATNTVIQRVGAKTGLICTRGFRDVLEVARTGRPITDAYNQRWQRPKPLVPRYLRLDVGERTDSSGHILMPLDEAEFLDAISFLRGHGVDSVAICFLFSYLNPANERVAKALMQTHHPDLPVSISSEILPQWREYERTSTTVCDAYVKPVMARYIGRLQSKLKQMGFRRDVLIMKSNGGVMNAETATAYPVETFVSGPAAAVVAAQKIGEQAGVTKLVSMDMGGTSFDVAVLDGDRLQQTTEGEVEPTIPIHISMLEIGTIGAGGGSIAWRDAGGALKVGPQSAGSTPGPACYGRGGERPTTTDANVVLGRIVPDHFLGGTYLLRADLAKAAISRLAEQLGLDQTRTACGIIDVTVSNMAQEIRATAARRGADLREYALFAGGGAGPIHAPLIARELGMPRVLIPRYPGMLSTIGLLLSEIRFDSVRSMPSVLEGADMNTIAAILREMEAEGRERVAREGSAGIEVGCVLQLDMRYRRQNWEIAVTVDPDRLDRATIAAAFDAEHDRRFGFKLPEQQHEMINLRCTVSGRIPEAAGLLDRLIPVEAERDGAPFAHRPVFDETLGCVVEAPLYERDQLRRRQEIKGTALVIEPDSTLYIPADTTARIDDYGNLMIEFDRNRNAESDPNGSAWQASNREKQNVG